MLMPKLVHGTNSNFRSSGNIHVRSKKLTLVKSNLKFNLLHWRSTDKKISANISSPSIELSL